MTHYDLLVIGTGSGNSIVDERFSTQRVAIAESGLFGGTCLNVGCIPTKMFVHTADLAVAAGESERFGITTRFESADWPAIRDRIFNRIDPIESDGRDYRTNRLPNVTVHPEHVRFTGPKSFRTESGFDFTADRVVIAAGSRPNIPRIPGLDAERVDAPGYPVLTSDTVMRMEELPRSMTIVGGGVVAVEFAHVFSALGVEVTVLVRGSGLLTDTDETVSQRFTEAFAERHHVVLGSQIDTIELTESGVLIEVGASDRVPEAEVPAPFTSDVLLLATGRSPNIFGLGAEAAGIDTAHGRIAVDAYQRALSGGAPLPGVFALGDVSSPYQLKHVANHEADVVQANLLADIATGEIGTAREDQLRRTNHHAVPAAVFSDPQTATVGATEAELRDFGVDYTCKIQEYSDVAYGWALEDSTGFAKVLADRHSRRILGAHIVGHEASMIIQPLVQAMAFGLPADVMASGQYWIHPALPEVVENALLGLEFAD
ncbi:mycothione reductase [Brevibacterium daeguense]|uniref:Mycothione reductase n=1 Tax=Brevibacterium daeguense TaxID=909936 RepID=A0ABP8EP81_9MICO|nr:mycothione reductase [Brevibacterium daeguense]